MNNETKNRVHQIGHPTSKDFQEKFANRHEKPPTSDGYSDVREPQSEDCLAVP